jgi:threonine/homoserine/homoserine lactone efflux protein
MMKGPIMFAAGALTLTGLGLGIAYAAAPGAVNTEAIRRGLAHGSRSALLVETGSLLGDSLWAILALTGLGLVGQHLAVQMVLGIAGGCFLLRMAWNALHDAWIGKQAQAPQRARGDLATGAFFGLANPFGLAFWSGLGSGIMATGATWAGFALLFGGFFVGASLWCLGLAALIRWGRRWVRPNVFRMISALCGVALGYFGVRLIWSTLQEAIERRIASSTAIGSFRPIPPQPFQLRPNV